MSTQTFAVIGTSGTKEITVNFDLLIAVGFAGRNQAKVREHIEELAEIGVKPPSKTPMLYVCSTQLVTKEENIQVIGSGTSGEVEYVIVLHEGEIFIGLGSDHTDRALEAVGIFKAKQINSKVIAPVLWRYEDVKAHWDKIELRAWQTKKDMNGGKEFAYQDGTLAAILTVEDVLAHVAEEYPGVKNAIFFSGTVPVLDTFIFGDSFRCELRDPILGRVISHEYTVQVLNEGLE